MVNVYREVLLDLDLKLLPGLLAAFSLETCKLMISMLDVSFH